MVASGAVPFLSRSDAPTPLVLAAIVVACMLTATIIARWGGFWRRR